MAGWEIFISWAALAKLRWFATDRKQDSWNVFITLHLLVLIFTPFYQKKPGSTRGEPVY
jgi:hypothetical protein